MLVTVHDLSFRQMGLHRIRSHLYLSIMTGSAVRRAKSIIADSEHSRRGVEQAYPRTRGRVQVIYGGLAPGLRRPSSQELERFRAEHKLDRPVILYVGTLEPRKNLTRLVHAYEKAVERYQLPHALVLLGPPGWRMVSLARAIHQSTFRQRILLPGYANDEALSAWYSLADLLAYPSLEEGFGLPVLEAMALGTPVITSNVSALPEVVGDAAIQLDPHDIEAIASAIGDVLMRPELAQRLSQAGRLRAAQFTWAAAAHKHVQAYADALNGTGH
jgi:glycosyltransferase involved in cell wall biosynthesis